MTTGGDYWVTGDTGDVRELGRCAGVCVVAESDDGSDVSLADGGGVGRRGSRDSAGVRPVGERDASGWNVPCRLVRCERSGPVGHGRQRVGVDGGLLGRKTAAAVWFAAVPGSTSRTTSVPARAAGSVPAVGSTTAVFVLRGRWISS